MANCINGTLTPYVPSNEAPWNRRRIQHLYNRIGNGASLAEINEGLTKTPEVLVDELIDAAIAVPTPDTDRFWWAYSPNFTNDEDDVFRDHRYSQLLYDFAAGFINTPVRHKLTFFWHSHFTNEIPRDSPLATYIYLYYRMLVDNALGNFKTFTEQAGLTPRMLLYLNGRDNKVGQANENYGRELLELFTLGEGNYTQGDIENIARALTGWKVGSTQYHLDTGYFALYPDDTVFTPSHHDWNTITLFGQIYEQPMQPADPEEAKAAAYATYQWVHDTIFQEKQTILARFICRKFYRFYVYHEPNEDIVNGLAATFMANNWEIAPVLRQLFKSEHFFHEEAMGVHIKSPWQFYTGFIKQTGLIYNTHWFNVSGALHPDFDPNDPFGTSASEATNRNHIGYIHGYAGGGGQILFQPPSVAGWAGARAWINEERLVTRWEFMRRMLQFDLQHEASGNAVRQHYVNFLIELTDNSTDPELVTQAVIDHYLAVPLSDEHFQEALIAFKSQVDDSYFDSGQWNLYFEEVPAQFHELISYLYVLPEFQMV